MRNLVFMDLRTVNQICESVCSIIELRSVLSKGLMLNAQHLPREGVFPNRHAGAMNKTPVPSIDSIERQWYLVDAENQTLGRLATEVAAVLRGKNNPSFTPHLDTGDFVVVVNADKIRVTGSKSNQKLYRRHSGRPGGMKVETFEALQARIPERIVEQAIKGMLPHNALGRQMYRKLKVYRGAEHPHAAQQPKALKLNSAAAPQ